MYDIVFRYDPDKAEEHGRPANAEEAIARLVSGNEHFAHLWQSDPLTNDGSEVIPFDGRLWGLRGGPKEIPAQQPFAAVLSCADARVPTELVFHRSLNDLFVVRLAGNVTGNEAVGSLAFSLLAMADSVKLLVVLGHTGCGAVTAAVDAYLQPEQYPGATPAMGLRQVVDRILLPVRTAAKALEAAGVEGEESRDRLISTSVVLNAALTAMTVQEVLADLITVDRRVVYGVYDLGTGAVNTPSGVEAAMEPGLGAPPSSMEQFEQLAARLAAQVAHNVP